MDKSKEEYENIINNSILFSLDKEVQNTIYKREVRKLIKNIYAYIMCVNTYKYEEYALEITETASECIKRYEPEKGDFLNYFNYVFSKNYKKAYAKEIQSEKFRGIHIPKKDQSIISKYMKLSKYKDGNGVTEKMKKDISDLTNISIENVEKCLVAYEKLSTVSDVYKTEDIDISLFDTVITDNTISENFEKEESLKELLICIDETFKERQERQKTLISKIITSKISLEIKNNNYLIEIAKKLNFFDIDIFSICIKENKMVKAKDIGKELNISEQSVSRTYKKFINYLKENFDKRMKE